MDAITEAAEAPSRFSGTTIITGLKCLKTTVGSTTFFHYKMGLVK